MTTKPKARAKRGRELPDDACPMCGTMMRRTQEALTSSVNGEEVRVPNISHLRCPKCGEGLFSLQEAEALRLGAFDIYRRTHGLLSADEIRAIRERYFVSVATPSPDGRRGATYRPPRWTCCCVSSATCRGASSICATMRREDARRRDLTDRAAS